MLCSIGEGWDAGCSTPSEGPLPSPLFLGGTTGGSDSDSSVVDEHVGHATGFGSDDCSIGSGAKGRTGADGWLKLVQELPV